MDPVKLQQLFFQHIKERQPEHISLVDELADLLEISNDSVYRRMRGEKTLSLDELHQLCTHYKISLDQLFSIDSNAVVFSGKPVGEEPMDFENYMEILARRLADIERFEHKQIFCSAKDIPVFHYFLFPEVASFKFFFWRKTMMEVPGPDREQFAIDDLPDSVYSIGRKALEIYNNCPSVELWNVETVNSIVQQIEFCKESGLFAEPNDAVRIYVKLEEIIDHLENQAKNGCKFLLDGSPDSSNVEYQLFFNEVYLGDNTYLVITGKQKSVYMTYFLLKYMSTRDEQFCEYIHRSFVSLMHKSSLISSVGEKERIRFFNSLREKIHRSKLRVV